MRRKAHGVFLLTPNSLHLANNKFQISNFIDGGADGSEKDYTGRYSSDEE